MATDNTVLASSTAGTPGLPVATTFGSGSRVVVVDPTVTTEDGSGTMESMDPVNLLKGALNEMSTTQGGIPYRDSSAYAILAPGAAGLSLLSGGSGANPSYGRPDPILWSLLTVNTAVANTNTQTTLFNTGSLRGSLTIPAGRLSTAGCRLALKLYGGVTVTGTPTLTLTVKIGGQTLFTGTTAALSAATSRHWYLSHDNIFVPVIGASGKIAGSAQLIIVNAGSSTLGAVSMTSGGTGGESAPITVDTTGTLVVDILVTWSVGDPSNSIRLDYGDMEVIGG